jgi:hypothetical protein
MRIGLTGIFVDDQDQAEKFYQRHRRVASSW